MVSAKGERFESETQRQGLRQDGKVHKFLASLMERNRLQETDKAVEKKLKENNFLSGLSCFLLLCYYCSVHRVVGVCR